MPTGEKLTGKISQLLALSVEFRDRVTDGDQAIYMALKKLVNQHGWGENNFILSARSVSEAMQLALSIDTFLESHRDNREFVQLGKLGIVRAISAAEARSRMRPGRDSNSPFRMPDLSDTWYYSLARQLFTGLPANRPERAFENVAFVVFNYDRYLQVFLVRAAEIYFRITSQEAAALIQKVRFIHPYGNLGSVFAGSKDYVPFASEQFDLLGAASRIRTFSESSELELEIQRKVCDADTIVFLGFGFHDQNIEMLSAAQNLGVEEPPPKRVFGTSKGLSSSDESVVRAQVSRALWARPEPPNETSSISLNNDTCAALFAAYWRSLTN